MGAGLSPRDLVQLALEENREVAAARLEVARAQARLQQATRPENPELEVEHAEGLGQQEDTATVSVPLPLFGRRKAAVEVARAELAGALAETRERERQILRAVLGAHAELIGAVRAQALGEELLAVDRQLRQLVAGRVEAADAPALDLRLLDVEIERLSVRQALANAQLTAQGFALRALIGGDVSEPLVLRSDMPLEELAPDLPSADAAVARALAQRPDLLAAEAAERAAEAALRQARSEARPRLDLIGTYSHKTAGTRGGEEERLAGGGIGLSLPLFNRNRGAIAEAELAIEQAQLARQALELEVEAEVRGALVRWQAAQGALDAYNEEIVPQSQANLETLRQAYQVGGVPLSEVLTEQRRMLESEADFAGALGEAYRSAADLRLAIGEDLGEDLGEEPDGNGEAADSATRESTRGER